MNSKLATALLSALTLVALSGSLGANARNDADAAPGASIPMFSTDDIGRQAHFYVGGHWAGPAGKETMDGAMYVEAWAPKKIRHLFPVVFVVGSTGQGAYSLIQTPDGRPGWAYDFVRQGYTIYMMDYPDQGRSAYNPDLDGKLNAPRSGPLMEEIWTGGRPPASEATSWPQYKKYSQWPSDSPNKGQMGDPVFDYFAKTETQALVPTPDMEMHNAEAIAQLLDVIGQPVIMILHSGAAGAGWLAIDSRPKLVKGIVAIEPVAPPIEQAERGNTGPARLWGITNLPIHYDPPVREASELKPVRQDKADGPGLIPCFVQSEPAHKLVNFETIPVLNFSGEASYHRPYAHCIAKWLNQAGVKTKYVNLEDVGLTGNGHQMMSERNSAGISKFMMAWIQENVR